MQDPLAHIHDAITRLRRLRTLVRVGSAVCISLAGMMAGLLVMFLLDWVSNAGRIERVILLLLLAAGMVWVCRRHLLPALRTHEADTDLALLIERQQGIDTDLVAAVQFADGRRQQFGSVPLRSAVVAYVEEVLPNLDLLEGFDTRPMRPALGMVAVAFILWLLLLMIVPGHVGAFAARAVLMDTPYPTTTRIIRIVEPGEVARAAAPVLFAVRLDGVLPEQAEARLRSVESRMTSHIVLTPDPDDPSLFVGQLRIADSDLDYQIIAGDATSSTRRLRVVPAPRVTMAVTDSPPAYTGVEPTTTSARRIVAAQGSTLEVKLSSDQPLGKAWVSIGDQQIDLLRDGPIYRPVSLGPPLSPLASSLSISVGATDEHELPLENLPTVQVSMQPDQPPTIRTQAVTRRVLPTGMPRLHIEARDDFGIQRLLLHRTIVPADGEPISLSTLIAEPRGSIAHYDQAVPVNLSELGLNPGDRLELAVEVFDHRGPLPEQSARSAPIVLDVIDRQMLLDSLLESDRDLDQRLDRVIETQLNVGGQTR